MRAALRRLTSWLICKVKNDSSYVIDERLDVRAVLGVLFERGVMALRGVAIYPWLLSSGLPIFIGSSVKLRNKHRLIFGKGCVIGNNVTIDALSAEGVIFGRNVTVPDHAFIRCTGVISDLGVGLKIGNDSGLGHFNFINAQGGVVIGNNVIIGPHVKILSENHVFDNIELPIKSQGVTRRGIVIQDNVWIGAGVCILDGVTVGSGAVVAAGAVVNKDVPVNSIVAGCPAKVIKYRHQAGI